MPAKQVTGGDVWNVEVGRDQRSLGSLARARRRNHEYPHLRLITPRSEPCSGPVWYHIACPNASDT